MNNLAHVHYAQGNYEEAIALFQKSLKINENTYGSEHQNVATCLSTLASVYSA